MELYESAWWVLHFLPPGRGLKRCLFGCNPLKKKKEILKKCACLDTLS